MRGRVFIGLTVAWLLAGPISLSAEDSVVITADTTIPNDVVQKRDLGRLKPFLEALPEGNSLRLQYTTFNGGGPQIRYIMQVTPQNPEGKSHGVEIEFPDWYQARIRETPFVNGLRHGMERIYNGPKGPLQAELPWSEGALHGTKKRYHPNKQVASEVTYEKGVSQGESRSYAPDGQVLRVTTFVDGKRHGVLTDYWRGRGDTVKRVVPYRNGKVDGVSKSYYANGQIKSELPFVNNQRHGVEKQYADDGKVLKTRQWRQGKPAKD